MIFRPTSSLTGTLTFCFGGATNPQINDITPVKFTAVYSRAFSRILPFQVPAYTLATATLTASANSLNLNAGSKYTITVDTTSTIPAGGSIAIRFPNTYIVQAASVVSGFPAGTKATIDISVAGFSIAVITTPTVYSKVANGVASFNIYVNNPSTAGSFTFQA